MTDLVNHPSHYKTESGLEVIDMIEQGLEKYDHRDQVLKYVYRAPSKGNYLQDLQKAQWYLNRTVQNVIDGKFKPNEVKIETCESFDLNYNKIAVPEPKPLFGPFTKKESKPKYDKDKVWKDKDGDAWECIEGAWVTGDTHEERVETGHEMLEYGDYYTDLPERDAPYTEYVTRIDFDESKRYLDDDGDIWGFYDGYWYFGGNHQDLEDKFGDFAHQWIRPCVNIEHCTVVEAPEYGTPKLYKDRDGDVWEYISGLWVFGRDHDLRAAKRADGYGVSELDEDFAPFEEVEDENGETV